ncbi:unnamed protein product [Kuraishia capsulata CBS 1993]|uniref:CBS domain-containing protein n=1 Tax=Kuraishia capsulata CBS 1993 TaxID=1382522 RepID=W6MW72_9ASCO|nr:uncharacterized protein KUCA_T00002942001 [Kuraishia capsulata CBS 1993]CDK26965.1 unnamed protein product [Kuraishia capsulata CBS 1993]
MSDIYKSSRRLSGGAFALRPDVPVECLPTCSIIEASRMMIEQKTYCIVVRDDDSQGLSGLFTAKDLAFRVVASGLDPYETQVKDIMTRKPLVSHVSNPHEALRLMVKKKVRHLPLVDDFGAVVGMLNITKCSYQAMVRLERDSLEAEKLQSTFQEIQIDGDSSESRFTLINREDSPIDADYNIIQQKQKLYNDLYNDFRKLIELMEQPNLRDVLNDSSLEIVPPIFIDARTTVLKAAQILKERKTTALLICDSSEMFTEPIGIFTSKDIVFRVLATEINPAATSVARVMTSSPSFASEELGIHSALRMMYEGNYMNLPIKNNENTVVGLISVLQLTYALLCHLDRDLYANLFSSADQEMMFDVDPINAATAKAGHENSVAWDHFWSLDRPLGSRRNSSFTERSFSESPRNSLRRLSRGNSRPVIFSPHRGLSSTTSHSVDGDEEEESGSHLVKNRFRSIPSTILSSRYAEVRSLSESPIRSGASGSAVVLQNASNLEKPSISILSNVSAFEKTFKIRTNDGKVYKIRLHHDVNLLDQLSHQIESRLGLAGYEEFYLSYTDEENDDVVIRKEEDLLAALELFQRWNRSTVHLKLHTQADYSTNSRIVEMLAGIDVKKLGIFGGVLFGTLFFLCTGVVVGMNVRRR